MKQPRWQRCEPRARQPPEPLAGPATVLALGGEISCRDRAEGKVSAPVMKAAGHPSFPVVLSAIHSRTAPLRAEIAPVGL